jgi:asparagine synthase (glutamine-hydrolysing)
MCGIAGKVSFTNVPVAEQAVERMLEPIKHRGPDDGGVYVSPERNVGLGHRRLSIIDLSPLGHQPMRYQDRYEIVFNGEIYNFQEKRALLEAAGHRFVSHSDTEVILALYAQYGAACLAHLRGMFAFAIYDEGEQTLFCARDRTGKKPFKYYADDKAFLFASELKAILTQPEYSREPDYTAIHHYLTLQYTLAPRTGFKDIRKLEPGHALLVDLKTRRLTKTQYWKLDYSHKLSLSEQEWGERIVATLDEATRLRMIADVPVGAFLSGGIDSSAVVALMSRHTSRPVNTFSIGFKEEKYNELPFARLVAERYGTEHTEFIVEPQAIDVLPMLVRHYEEPYADSSALPTYYLSKLTRDHVTVALNGDGGDENFAGYGRYSAFKFSLLCEKPGIFHRAIGTPLARTASGLFRNTFFERLHRFSQSLSVDYRRRYLGYTSYFTNAQKAELYAKEFKARVWGEDTYDLIGSEFDLSGSTDRAEQALYADFVTYLPDDLLVKVDIASMAVALEARSPFLDHEFVELCAQIPFAQKLKGLNQKKHILKKSLESLLPKEVLYRPKMGFNVPIDQWFRSELREYSRERLLNGRLMQEKLFNRQYLERILDTHSKTAINLSPHIWALLTLELWFEEFFPAR